MLGTFIAVLLGFGMVVVAIAAWTWEPFAGWMAEWGWRNQAGWLPKRGPYRRRTLAEARTGVRAAALLMGLFGAFLTVLVIVSVL